MSHINILESTPPRPIIRTDGEIKGVCLTYRSNTEAETDPRIPICDPGGDY